MKPSIFEKFTRWFIFNVIAAMVPFAIAALYLMMQNLTPTTTLLFSKGELLLVSFLIAAAAEGELIANGKKLSIFKVITGGGCLLLIILNALLYGIIYVSNTSGAGYNRDFVTKLSLWAFNLYSYRIVWLYSLSGGRVVLEYITIFLISIMLIAALVSVGSSLWGLATSRGQRVEERLRIFQQRDYLLQLRYNQRDQTYNKVLKSAIEHTLEAAVRALIFPKTEETDSVVVRAFCHLADTQHGKLVPFALYSFTTPSDRSTAIPFKGPDAINFVIAEAYNTGKIVLKDLEKKEPITYAESSFLSEINPDLKCVLAAPIKEFHPLGDITLGTVSFDSTTHRLSEIGFDTESASDVIKNLAESIFLLLQLKTEAFQETVKQNGASTHH